MIRVYAVICPHCQHVFVPVRARPIMPEAQAVYDAIARSRVITVKELRAELARIPDKVIANILAYLVRVGKLRRVSRGIYEHI